MTVAAWLKLVRWKNLLIIFVTQFLAWRCIITPHTYGLDNTFTFFFTTLQFVFLSVSTVLIAAAGYIINDYFDIRIDNINRPGKVVLGNIIPRKTAIIAHAIINVTALLLAGNVALQLHRPLLPVIQFASITLLWFYSTHFKRQYITGNVAVALLTALTIIILVIYNPGIYINSPGKSIASPYAVYTLLAYAGFAFLLTWMREVVKDMEDFKGDEAEGCITMPIKKGLEWSVGFVRILSALVLILLLVSCYLLFVHAYLMLAGYILAILIIPITLWAANLGKQYTAAHYERSSRWLKVIMVLGVLSFIVYYLQLFINHAA